MNRNIMAHIYTHSLSIAAHKYICSSNDIEYGIELREILNENDVFILN